MIWLLTIILQLLFGGCIAFSLSNKDIRTMDLIALSIPLGILSSSLIYFVTSSVFGLNIVHLSVHNIFIITIVVYYCRNAKFFRRISISQAQIYEISAATILSLFSVLPFYSISSFRANPAIADGLFDDISIINSFRFGINSGYTDTFHIHHTGCFKCFSVSDWLVPFHSAMLTAGGAPISVAYTIPHFLYCLALYFLGYSFFHSLSSSHLIACISFVLYFLLGGYGFKNFFVSEYRKDIGADYVYNLGNGKVSQWSHLILHSIIGSRSFCSAMSICFSVLILLSKKTSPRLRGIMIGFLPSVKMESFFSIAILSFLCSERSEVLTEIGGIFISGIIPIFNLPPRGLNYQRMNFQKKSISYLFQNLGAFPAFAALFSCRDRIFFSAIAVTIVGMMVKFHCYDFYDSIFFVSSAIPVFCAEVCIGVRNFLRRLKSQESKGLCIGLFGFLFALQILSSVFGLAHSFATKSAYISEKDKKVAEFILSNTSKKAIFMVSERYHHPIPILTGRRVFLSPPLAMFTWNFDSNSYRYEQRYIPKNPACDLQERVRYLVEDPWMSDDFKLLMPDALNNWNIIFDDNQTKIYQRNPPCTCNIGVS